MYTISKKSAVNLSLKFPDINRNGQGADGKVLNFTNNQRNANPSAGVSFLSYCEKFNENTQDQGKCENGHPPSRRVTWVGWYNLSEGDFGNTGRYVSRASKMCLEF